MEPHPPEAHGGPCFTAGGYSKEAVAPHEAWARASSWQDLWIHGGPMLEKSVPEGLHPTEGIHAEACEGL